MAHTPVLEGRGTGQVLQQNFAFPFVLAADEAQAQEKTPEGVFLIVHRLLGRCHPLGIPAHLAKCGDEVGVGGCGIRIYLGEPGERHPVVQHLDAKVGDAQGLPDQVPFGVQQLSTLT